jgi:tetratricopeptide (TPR) repeat protein
MGLFDDCIRHIKKSIKYFRVINALDDIKIYPAYFLVGRAYIRLKKFSKARKYITKAKQLIIRFRNVDDDVHKDAMYYIAIIEIESGNFNKCERMCCKALASNSKNTFAYWMWIGILGIFHSKTNN